MLYPASKTISYIQTLRSSDICGLWEVIRISQRDSHQKIYPWIKDRFKFDFLPEMMFICLRYGQNSQGTWYLSEKTSQGQKRYSIILNETFQYVILDICEDDITISDQINDYLLVRKL